MRSKGVEPSSHSQKYITFATLSLLINFTVELYIGIELANRHARRFLVKTSQVL